MEHATEEYQSINPNGLVPTLIHDGRTYIESIDIIQYLDEVAPVPSLAPADPTDQPVSKTLLKSADDAQVSLKRLTHEFLFRGSGRYCSEENQTKFSSSHKNKWLVEFKRAFAARDANWQANVESAIRDMEGHFRNLEHGLATSRWLIGNNFTLADVAWSPNVHRMHLMEWPMALYPDLSRWYSQLQQRPSFQQAVIDCEPAGVRSAFSPYVAQRRKEARLSPTRSSVWQSKPRGALLVLRVTRIARQQRNVGETGGASQESRRPRWRAHRLMSVIGT
jgi:glutathione S-transferase